MDPLPRWRRLWRVERVEVYSPLPVWQAADRLGSGTTTRREALVELADPRGRVVWGGVDGREVRLWSSARMVQGRNAWSPLLRGELISAGPGCRLVGTLGWRPFTRVFSCFWLALTGVFLVGGMVAFGAHAAAGSVSGGDVLVLLVPAAMISAFLAMVAGSGRQGWQDAAFLLQWIRERLDAS